MLPTWRYRLALGLALAAAGSLHLISGSRLKDLARTEGSAEMRVAIPLFVQVAMAGGDRYLAANLAGFRALVSSTDRMSEDEHRILARVQSDAAWLNPAHEDNYYIAAALLPWNDEYDAAQTVLRRAIDGRPFDWGPIFYYAFNLSHFRHEAAEAANWLRIGAERARSENDRLVLQSIAVRWFEKGYDTRTAIRVVEAMAEQSRHSAFTAHLRLRAARLKNLLALEEATERFRMNTGRPIRALDELVDAGLIPAIPSDPFQLGYGVNASGKPILLTAPPARSGMK